MTRACPLCGGEPGPPFLVRAAVPVHQNLTAVSAERARSAARGRLEMTACVICGFVFNRAFDAGLLAYGPDYDNTQSLSAAFDDHLTALARHLVERRGVRGARIIEVGCGRGDFLRRLVAWPGADNTGIGFDPAYRGGHQADGGRLRFERRFYGPDCADIPADVVICRHVIEHIADPLALLASVRGVLRHSPRARVFFETPDVGWILRHGVLWDFFYEHCSLFSAATLTRAFAGAGFTNIAVRHVFADQYLWLEAEPGEPGRDGSQAGPVVGSAWRYGQAEAARRAMWHERITDLAAQGSVAVWGAGAKGATFVSLTDPHATLIDCLVDINPAKQGRFVPGTGHPIVAPRALTGRGVRHVVLMNPAYRAEVADMLPTLGGARLAEWEA